MKLVQNQPPQSDRNGKTTLEKGGRDPPDCTLDDVFNNLLLYIGGSPHLNRTYENIKKKYNIKKGPDCWPADDIKRAWGKTQRMDKTSLKRKRWSLAILLLMIKRQQKILHFDESETSEAQPDQSNVGDLSQSCAEEGVNDTSHKAHNPQERKDSKKKNYSQTVYIRIPLSVMFQNESTSQRGVWAEKNNYKLIDRFPFLNEIIKKKSYVLLYNNQTRNAAWVYEILNRDTLLYHDKNKKANKKDVKYKDDTIDPLQEAAKYIEECDTTDYEHGHLASAANHKWCQEAYEDTFSFSNIAPQVPVFNRDLWKRLEDHCQQKVLSNQNIRNVHVYTGPLYLSDRKKRENMKIWKSKMVPTHFFKVIIVEHNDGKVELECYEMPNKNPEDENNRSNDKNIRSKGKNDRSKDKTNRPKDKNSQLEDKNDQSNDINVLQKYEVPINWIEKVSGLRFTESSCNEGEIDSTRKVIWKGTDANEKLCTAKIKVTISTPLTDHNDSVYI